MLVSVYNDFGGFRLYNVKTYIESSRKDIDVCILPLGDDEKLRGCPNLGLIALLDSARLHDLEIINPV